MFKTLFFLKADIISRKNLVDRYNMSQGKTMIAYKDQAPFLAKTIADWFIAYSDNNEINALSLQKLLYFAQAHYLEEKQSELFEEPIEAWEHGPVVRTVFNEHKAERPIQGGQYNAILHNDFSFDDFSDEINDFLVTVWNTYGIMRPKHLEQKTHKELPWSAVWNDDQDKSKIISSDLIHGYYEFRKIVVSDHG